MMALILRKFALLTCLGLFAVSGVAQIHVSPDGNDGNPGSITKPVHTLEKAVVLARAVQQKAADDTTIVLAGGVYRLEQPLVLTPEDSGANGHNLIFEAKPGQQPVISGGAQITGWTLYNQAKNIWTASVPAKFAASRQIYIDGVRASRTRGRSPVALKMTETGYVAADASMAAWKNAAAIEFVYTGGNAVWSEKNEGIGSWTEPRCPVAKIEGATITMAQPCWINSTKRIMLPSGIRTANLVGPMSVGKEPAYIENAFELLGTPGQFYIDRTNAAIYYVPRKGEDLSKADVELAGLKTLVEMQGTAARPVHNIIFKGVQFSYATWLGPNSPDGFSEIQAGYQVTGSEGWSKQGLCDLVPNGFCPFGAWTKEPGNIKLNFAHDVHFIRDAFVHLGATGLDLGPGAQNTSVEGSVFSDISGNGVELASVDAPLAPDAEFAVGNRIVNNLFENVGAEYRGGIGIVVGYARNTLVSHNQIDQIPYAAISIGWGGWPDKIQKAGQANNSAHNIISDNLIHHEMLVLSDGGGIYTQGRTGKTLEDGELVSGNVIHDQYGTGHAIYTDNGSSMITVRGNVMFQTNHDNWGSRHRNWYDGNAGKINDPLHIAGNYWQQGDQNSDKEAVVVEDNHLIHALDQAPKEILASAGIEPAFRQILSRRFARASAPEAPSRVAAWGGNGFADVTWNPTVNQGGSPVEAYIVRASNGAEMRVFNEEFWKNAYVKFNGLPNGQALTFTVAAINQQGASEASMPSHPVTLSTAKLSPIAAPENVAVYPGKGAVSIHFQLPSGLERKDGTEEPDSGSKGVASPILAYAVTVTPGGRKVYFTGRNIVALEGRHVSFNVVDGLQSGAEYTFSVSAVGNSGEGAPAVVGPVRIP
ncbi:MAG: right-handed parallel beta-helix repeat-containing protein [Terracidiphilus sp.]|nr:right-handed parallel beta-helix repeat-containing protein [Terracidiphilus sp.]